MSSKYDPLKEYLTAQSVKTVTLTFEQVEKILGFSLPASAREYRAWWANEAPHQTRHSHSLAWTLAGRTAIPDLGAGTVDFSK